jgi:chitinase
MGFQPVVQINSARICMFRFALLLILLLTTTASAERLAIGYYANFGDLPVEQIPFRSLTHLVHAFLRTDDAGKLVTTDAVPNPALVNLAHKNGVQVLVCLGGGRTVQGLEKVTADPALLEQFVASVVKLVTAAGYDGVDLAWEFPRNRTTGTGFTTLLAALRQALDAAAKAKQRQPYLLTAMLPGNSFFGDWIAAEQVSPLVDWLEVQTYDFSGPGDTLAAHSSGLFPAKRDPERRWRSVSHAMEYWSVERKVPKQKLVVGLPLFGRTMPVAKPYADLDPRSTKQHGVLGYNQIRTLVDKEQWTAEWDADSMVPWLSEPKQKGPVVAYDDRNSIHKKAVWAKEQQYRGMYYWALHQDRMPDGKHWLIDAANSAWPAR